MQTCERCSKIVEIMQARIKDRDNQIRNLINLLHQNGVEFSDMLNSLRMENE